MHSSAINSFIIIVCLKPSLRLKLEKIWLQKKALFERENSVFLLCLEKLRGKRFHFGGNSILVIIFPRTRPCGKMSLIGLNFFHGLFIFLYDYYSREQFLCTQATFFECILKVENDSEFYWIRIPPGAFYCYFQRHHWIRHVIVKRIMMFASKYTLYTSMCHWNKSMWYFFFFDIDFISVVIVKKAKNLVIVEGK